MSDNFNEMFQAFDPKRYMMTDAASPEEMSKLAATPAVAGAAMFTAMSGAGLAMMFGWQGFMLQAMSNAPNFYGRKAAGDAGDAAGAGDATVKAAKPAVEPKAAAKPASMPVTKLAAGQAEKPAVKAEAPAKPKSKTKSKAKLEVVKSSVPANAVSKSAAKAPKVKSTAKSEPVAKLVQSAPAAEPEKASTPKPSTPKLVADKTSLVKAELAKLAQAKGTKRAKPGAKPVAKPAATPVASQVADPAALAKPALKLVDDQPQQAKPEQAKPEPMKADTAKLAPTKSEPTKSAPTKLVSTKLAPVDADAAAAKVPVEQAKPAGTVADRPKALDAPVGGKADDLKRISGVGPKLEVVLNDLGIYHFSQIAVWMPKEVAWVDEYLRFSGRIERDDWISQAKKLAAS